MDTRATGKFLCLAPWVLGSGGKEEENWPEQEGRGRGGLSLIGRETPNYAPGHVGKGGEGG